MRWVLLSLVVAAVFGCTRNSYRRSGTTCQRCARRVGRTRNYTWRTATAAERRSAVAGRVCGTLTCRVGTRTIARNAWYQTSTTRPVRQRCVNGRLISHCRQRYMNNQGRYVFRNYNRNQSRNVRNPAARTGAADRTCRCTANGATGSRLTCTARTANVAGPAIVRCGQTVRYTANSRSAYRPRLQGAGNPPRRVTILTGRCVPGRARDPDTYINSPCRNDDSCSTGARCIIARNANNNRVLQIGCYSGRCTSYLRIVCGAAVATQCTNGTRRYNANAWLNTNGGSPTRRRCMAYTSGGVRRVRWVSHCRQRFRNAANAWAWRNYNRGQSRNVRSPAVRNRAQSGAWDRTCRCAANGVTGSRLTCTVVRCIQLQIRRVTGGTVGGTNGRVAAVNFAYNNNQQRTFQIRVNGRNARVRFRCCTRVLRRTGAGLPNYTSCGSAATPATPTRPRAPALQYCTGPIATRNALRSTAPYGSRCLHAPGTWRGGRWCTTGAHADSGPQWGWACVCNTANRSGNAPGGMPYCRRNAVCSAVNSSVRLKRGAMGTRVYTATVVASARNSAQQCVYTLRFPDGDVERGVRQTDNGGLTAVARPTFTVCQRVQANYGGRGRWYSARVTQVLAGGNYKVQYDDGDQETLNASRLRRVTAADTYTVVTFRAGQQVMGNYGGRGTWYNAVIARVNSRCSYNLRYTDGDVGNDIHPIFIRARSAPTTCTMAAGTRVTANWRGLGRFYPGRVTACTAAGYSIAYDDNSQETGVPAARIRAVAACVNPTFRNNQYIQGNYGGRGRWYDAKVVGCSRSGSNNVYNLRYCDGDTESNLAAARLRRTTTGARPSGCRV